MRRRQRAQDQSEPLIGDDAPTSGVEGTMPMQSLRICCDVRESRFSDNMRWTCEELLGDAPVNHYIF